MTRFDVITIFPELIGAFARESLLAKAAEKGVLDIRAHNLRDWTEDRHKTVDDEPYGGGLGQVFKVEPIYRAVQELKEKNSRVILFSPRGRRFTQKKAFGLRQYNQLIFICGRYEGVDERVARHVADETLSLGSFDLMGGEIPAMAVIETVSRLIPGVIGKKEFLNERTVRLKTHGRESIADGFMEYPQYTRPEVFEPEPGVRWRVPRVLVSGNHREIEAWRAKRGKVIA